MAHEVEDAEEAEIAVEDESVAAAAAATDRIWGGAQARRHPPAQGRGDTLALLYAAPDEVAAALLSLLPQVRARLAAFRRADLLRRVLHSSGHRCLYA